VKKITVKIFYILFMLILCAIAGIVLPLSLFFGIGGLINNHWPIGIALLLIFILGIYLLQKAYEYRKVLLEKSQSPNNRIWRR